MLLGNGSRTLGRAEALFEFSTPLPGQALDRIESFRDGGRLFARLEGDLYVLSRSDAYKPNPNLPLAPPERPPWIDALVQTLETGNQPLNDHVRSEPFELRETWCTQILATLRPPGRVVIDFQLPAPTDGEGERMKKILGELGKAQAAFDEGRSEQVAHICYVALDELARIVSRAEGRYGKYAVGIVEKQIKEAKSLCNPERHAERPDHDGLEFDRPLAQHALAVTSSLVGIVLR